MYKLSWHFSSLIMPRLYSLDCTVDRVAPYDQIAIFYALSPLCRFNQVGRDCCHMFGGVSAAPIISSITADCGCGDCGFTEKEKAWQVQGCLQPTVKRVSPLLLLHIHV